MTFSWRELPREEMDRHFNPRVAVPDAQAHLDRYAARSAEARRHIPGRYDLRYGQRPKETLDVHTPESASAALPLVVFVHGGYWRALDKSDHSFVVPPLLASGAVVANVNYDLCPSVTLDEMVDEIGNAVRFCARHAGEWGADPQRLYLLGHSAGAHLAAEMLLSDPPADGIQAMAGITGIYEPEIILGVSVNEEAQVSPEVATRRTCLGRTFRLRPRVLLAVGGDEPAGWRAQSHAFAGACRDAGLDTRLEVVPGANHFTVLERVLDPGEPVHRALTALWR